MKTFGFFMLLLFASVVIFSLTLTKWSEPDVVILSVLWSYIMYRFISKEVEK